MAEGERESRLEVEGSDKRICTSKSGDQDG